MGGLLKLISELFGKNALSKTIGTRTNVIKLPTDKLNKFTKRELDIENASDAAVEKAYQDMQELIPDIPRMNDQEKLIFEGNLRRLNNRMNPPSAEIIEFGTKKPVSKEGVESLRDELGIPSDVDPDSPLGRVMTKTKRISKEGKDLAKEFGMEDQLKKGLQDLMQEQKGMSKLYSEGLVRATVREIMDRDIKSGKIKLPEMEEDIIRFGTQGDPIDIFRKYYGENALEQVDSITPKLRELRTSSEAADLATKEFTFEPKLDRPPGSFDPNEPPEFAMGGRVGYQAGGAATPEQFAQALSTAGAGTAEQKTRSLMDYVSDYGSQAATAAVPAYQMAKGILGIQGGNLQTEGMTQALQDIIQNQYAQTGQLSGDIGYKDYGVETGSQGNFLGAGDVPLTDPRFALAATLGRASYSIDPNTGKVNFTGGTTYDFPEGSLPLGLGEFISKGGFFGDKAYDYSPDITLPKKTFATQQATTSTQQANNTSPFIYEDNGLKLTPEVDSFLFPSGETGYNLTYRSPEGYIVHQKTIGGEEARNLENYKVQGENPDGSFYTKYQFAEGGSVGLPYILGV